MESNNKKRLVYSIAALALASTAQGWGANCPVGTVSYVAAQPSAKHQSCLSVADAFLIAVADNNMVQARRLFAQGIDIDYRSGNRQVINHVNVRADKLNRYVIGKGRYKYGSGTAYDIALTQGNAVMTQWLLQNNANPAVGFFRRHIEKTRFSQDYPANYLNLPYTERARIISVGVVLAAAVEDNDHQKVTQLLRIEPRAIHYKNNKLLPVIIRLGKWSVAEAFLQYGKDIGKLHQYEPMLSELLTSEPTNYRMLETFLRRVSQEKGLDFFPLFMQALHKKDKAAMSLLVKYGANINVKDKKPPLVLMAEKEDIELVQFLLQLGANPNLPYSGQYLIHRAIANQQMPLAQALVAKGANLNVVDTMSRTPLQIAIYKKDDRFAQFLINKGANVHVLDHGKNNLLHIAAKRGKTRIARMLIAKGTNIQQRNMAEETPLLLSIRDEQLPITKALIAAGANPNVKDRYDNSPLGIALIKKDLAYVKLLISRNVNVNKLPDGFNSPLILAVQQVNIPLIKLLLAAGANTDSTERGTKNTPLHIAIDKANLSMMRLLLDSGSDINSANSMKQSPLNLASRKAHQSMVQLLLSYKPKLNSMDNEGNTALHTAVREGNLTISQLLLNAGAVPNSVNRYGNTPLLEALMSRKTRIAQLLIQKGANLNVANNYEKTPLDLALSKGLRGVATIMRNKGAQTGVELGAASSLRVELIDGKR